MMKSAILSGKTDAGNLHMRFVGKRACALFLSALLAGTAGAVWQPGLMSGTVSDVSKIVDTYPSTTNIVSSPVMAKTSGWGSNINYVYWGQIYLDGSTYNFAESIDDATWLKIDGTVVINNTSWSQVGTGSIMREAGWYDFEVRFYNGGGGGPVNQGGWGTTKYGFGYNTSGYTGKEAAGYDFPEDDGHASLFRYDDGFGADSVVVSGFPRKIAVEGMSHGYGTSTGFSKGQKAEFSVPGDTQILSDVERATCIGWKLYKINGDTGAREFWREGTGCTVSDYTHPDCQTELEWQWRIEYKVSFVCDGGDVDTNKLWYAEGEVATVEFTPDATHAFYKWAGDVDAASQKTNPLTFTVDGPKSIQAKTSALTNATTGGDLLAAVAAASETEPTIIEVAAGEIFLKEILNLAKPITVRGAGIGKTVLVRDPSVAELRALQLSDAEAVVEGMTISNFYVRARLSGTSTSSGLYMTAGTVRNCEFVKISNGCNGGADWNAGSMCATINGTSSKLVGCIFHGLSGGSMNGAAVWVGSGAIVDTCLFYGNSSGVNAGIVYVPQGTVRNCTVVGNTISSACAVYLESNASYLKDSIVYGNTGTTASSGSAVQGGGFDIKANSASTLTSCSLNNFTTDPGFVDAANHDYRLRPGSPCMDAGRYGDETLALTAHDASGTNARRIGNATDIGAYECDPGATPSCFFVCNSRRHLVGEEFVLELYSANGGETPTYTLDWGDGSEPEEVADATATHAYDRSGAFTVKLSLLGSADFIEPDYLTVLPKSMFVAVNGTGVAPYDNPEAPGPSLEAALEYAADGCTIWMADGDYKLQTSDQISLSKAISIRGRSNDPRKVTLTTKTKDSGHLLRLDHAGACVSGVTIFGGYDSAQNSYRGSCVTITSNGGMLTNCVIHSGKAKGYGGAAAGVMMSGGLVTHCVLSNHDASCTHQTKGSALYSTGGKISNCLFTGNKSDGTNGYTVHLAGGKMYNSTVAGNSHTAYAGVFVSSKDSRVVNCVIAENTSTDKSGDFVGIYGYESIKEAEAKECFSHCASPTKINDYCYDGALNFLSTTEKDYHLLVGSVCRDHGTTSDVDVPAVDLDGNPRIDKDDIDIGCYELHVSGPVASFAASETTTTGIRPYRLVFTPTIEGAADEEPITCTWKAGETVLGYSNGREPFVNVFTNSGTCRITMTATVGGSDVESLNSIVVSVIPPVLYVDKANATPVAPYETPATAANYLEDALAEAIDGCEIRIAKGFYPAKTASAITVGKGVTIRGTGDRLDDVVLSRKALNDSTNHRIFNLNHEKCLITGLTVSDGRLWGQGQHGAGISFDSRGGIVSNCVIRNCFAGNMDNGGGGCLIASDSAIVTHCIITNCSTRNSAPGNYADLGGNAVSMSAGILRDSLIAYNHQSDDSFSEKGSDGAVSIRGGKMINCTVVSNSSMTCSGIRAKGGQVINCIISGNVITRAATDSKAAVVAGTGTAFSHCLADKDVDGKFAVEDPSQTFLRPGNGNFRLRAGSKAIDAGDASAVTSTVDLRGNPRVQCGSVDLGCYEARVGMTIFVK